MSISKAGNPGPSDLAIDYVIAKAAIDNAEKDKGPSLVEEMRVKETEDAFRESINTKLRHHKNWTIETILKKLPKNKSIEKIVAEVFEQKETQNPHKDKKAQQS